MQKKKYLAATLTGIAVIGASVALFRTKPVVAQTERSAAVFTSDGKLRLPTGYRRWVFVGAPLTPNALNNGKAGFPEYHHVYVEAQNVDAYLKTGSFPEGTVIVKELTRVLNPTFPDGSRTEPSGRGYFNGEFNGMDVTVKDSKRFSKKLMGGASLPSAITRCRMRQRLRNLPRPRAQGATWPTLPRPI